MTNSGDLFSGYLTEWLLEAGFIQSQCQMSIYYKYAPDVYKIVFLSYLDECIYWYTNEDPVKCSTDNLVKRIWFMSIRIY